MVAATAAGSHVSQAVVKELRDLFEAGLRKEDGFRGGSNHAVPGVSCAWLEFVHVAAML